jgi:rhomboid protease GluP
VKILAAIVLWYAAMIVAWRWLLRRWRLVGRAAPPRAVLGRREYLARRSLRAVLAFDFLVIFPIGAPAIGAMIAVGREAPSGFGFEALLGLLGLVTFVLCIPVMRRSVVRLEQQRRDGQPEETAAQAMARARSTGHAPLDAHLAARAWGTITAALVIALVSIAAWVLPEGQLALRLAKENEAIRSGEVWRLVTVALVHAGPVHLLFNVWILLDVGGNLERLVGTSRMLLVLFVGTATGSAVSVALVPQPSVGASGGVLALAAALLVLSVRHWSELPEDARKKLVRGATELVALNLVLSFVLANVDWAAHLGGMFAGAVLGGVLPLSPSARSALPAAPAPVSGAIAG